MELALDTLQSTASHFLVLAQVLGIAICVRINSMVCSDDGYSFLGTCIGGLVASLASNDMDGGSDQAISYLLRTIHAQ